MQLLVSPVETFLGCLLARLSPKHSLDGVTRQGVEKEDEKHGQGEKSQDLDNCPLVVVPYYVTDRLDWVEEPHEG